MFLVTALLELFLLLIYIKFDLIGFLIKTSTISLLDFD